MQEYKDLSGNSGVTRYECGNDYIDIEFRGEKIYRYDYTKPGEVHVEKMKQLALSGEDLATYINQNVRKNFAAQLK
jgi:hypothetical protein